MLVDEFILILIFLNKLLLPLPYATKHKRTQYNITFSCKFGKFIVTIQRCSKKVKWMTHLLTYLLSIKVLFGFFFHFMSDLLNTKKQHIHSICFEVYYVVKPFWNKWLIFANTHRCDENSVISTKKTVFAWYDDYFFKKKTYRYNVSRILLSFHSLKESQCIHICLGIFSIGKYTTCYIIMP